jgi:hypothetical protein
MAGRPEIRIGNAERERAAGELGEHFSAGRLTAEEYGERVRVAYQARTGADLEPLFTDLPRIARPDRTARRRRDLRPLLILLVVAACVAWVAIVRVPPFFVFPLIWFVVGSRIWRHRVAHYR